MQGKLSFLDRLNTHLFENRETLPQIFDKDEIRMIYRYRSIYTKWYSEPMFPERLLVEYIVNEFDVSAQTAHKDIANVKILLGNVKNASKEFFRHAANEMLREAIELVQDADTALEVKKAEVYIKAALSLVDINKLKVEEGNDLKWSEIKPVTLEVTQNVEEIGITKKTDNVEALKRKLRKKYFDDEIVDTDFEPINDNESLPE